MLFESGKRNERIKRTGTYAFGSEDEPFQKR
jgi:hypothetical protein